MAKKPRNLSKSIKAAIAQANGNSGRYGQQGLGSRKPQYRASKITLPNAEAFARLGDKPESKP